MFFLEKKNRLPVGNCTTIPRMSSLVNAPTGISNPVLGGRRDLTVKWRLPTLNVQRKIPPLFYYVHYKHSSNSLAKLTHYWLPKGSVMRAYTLVLIPYINTSSIRFTVLCRFMRSEEKFFAPLSIIYEGFLLYSLLKTVDDTALTFESLAHFWWVFPPETETPVIPQPELCASFRGIKRPAVRLHQR
jgi:hypothetical protein